MIQFLKRLFCKHEWRVRSSSWDEGFHTYEQCSKCGKVKQ